MAFLRSIQRDATDMAAAEHFADMTIEQLEKAMTRKQMGFHFFS